MSYTPIKIVSVVGDTLVESTDLTRPLSAFTIGRHYLVVLRNNVQYCLSLGRILTHVRSLVLTQPVGSALTALLTDLFVTTYTNPTIPVKLASGLYAKRLVVFNPVAYKDFEVYFTSINTPHIKDDVTKKGFLDDLAIKSDQDMSNFLVAVNGVFHRTTIMDGVLYVLDGFRTIRLSGRKDVLVVDTKAVGGHTIVPLTSANVTKPAYQKQAIVTMPSSVQDKNVFAVIDGYFYHRHHKVVEITRSTKVKLNTNKMPLIQQFRHNPRTIYELDRFGLEASQQSRKYEDEYASVFLGEKSVAAGVFTNADFQYSRLIGYHSFLVVMNNANLFTNTIDLTPTMTPKFYQDLSSRHPTGMLNYGCGLCPSYLIWKDAHDRKSIFLSDQDGDIDRQVTSINPAFIPRLVNEVENSTTLPAQFVDYVCA